MMNDNALPKESAANILCKACGLCCTGHLFAWTKLRSPELDPIQDLGVQVFREPQQRGFNQPCPLWEGQCTVYTSPDYPRFCQTYKCDLLKELIEENIQFPEALTVIEQTKEMIAEVEALLPDSPNPNFRERLIEHLEKGSNEDEFEQKAEKLLEVYRARFDVDYLIDRAG